MNRNYLSAIDERLGADLPSLTALYVNSLCLMRVWTRA